MGRVVEVTSPRYVISPYFLLFRVALPYFRKGTYMIWFDLKSGYHHVGIHPDHQAFLGFVWKFPGALSFRYFVFTVLTFGLSSAPYIFTKCFKKLEKYWRVNGANIG